MKRTPRIASARLRPLAGCRARVAQPRSQDTTVAWAPGQGALPRSCNVEAQREFDVAMAYYHSFAWQQVPTRSSAP